MTGYGNSWGSWIPHTSLQTEWNEFETHCSERNDFSDLSQIYINLLQPKVEDAAERMDEGDDEVQHEDSAHFSSSVRATQEERYFSQASQLTQNGSEDHDIDSLLMELNEVLESANIPPRDDLLSALSEIPTQAYPKLLKRLREDLSPDGLHTLWQLAGDSVLKSLEQNSWLHPALVCKYIILPELTGEEECPNELCVVLEELARCCPNIVVSQILQPILTRNYMQRELVLRVTPLLPAHHHLKLVTHVLERCKSPLLIPEINVLMPLLQAVTIDVKQVWKHLMPLLQKSADALDTNEQFANLLLIIVRKLPSNTSQPIRDTLASIARQNKSFNRQLLLNALSTVQLAPGNRQYASTKIVQ